VVKLDAKNTGKQKNGPLTTEEKKHPPFTAACKRRGDRDESSG